MNSKNASRPAGRSRPNWEPAPNGTPGLAPQLRHELVKYLAKIPEVDAIFVGARTGEPLDIYTVVPEHRPEIAEKVHRQETRLEKQFPKVKFYFHIRAHQGRKPSEAVPHLYEPLFVR